LANTNVKRSTHLEEILSRATLRHEPEVEAAEQSLKEMRGATPTPMLDIVLKDGTIRSFNYAYLSVVEVKLRNKLIISFTTGATIIVEGRGLARHRQQVRLHRADEIREPSDSERMLQGEDVLDVERIYITEGEAA